jgi:hypothetical protein
MFDLFTMTVSKTVTAGVNTAVFVKRSYADVREKFDNASSIVAQRNLAMLDKIEKLNLDQDVAEEVFGIMMKYGELPSTMFNHLAMEVALKTFIAKHDIRLEGKDEVEIETIGAMLERIRRHTS